MSPEDLEEQIKSDMERGSIVVVHMGNLTKKKPPNPKHC